MEKTLKLLEFDKVLMQLSEFAVCEAGKVRCLTTGITSNTDQIKYEQTLTTSAKKILDAQFKLPLDPIKNIQIPIKKALSHLTLEPEEIIDIGIILKNIRLCKNFLEKNASDFIELTEFKNKLTPNKELEDEIFSTFDSKLSINQNATPELKRLHLTFKDTETNIKQTIQKLLSNNDFTAQLQSTVHSSRDNRVVFQVKAEYKNKCTGIVHDVSASGQTYFIEPKALVTLNNKLKEVQIGILAEIDKILRLLTQKIANITNDLTVSINTLTELDFIFAKAKYSIKLNAVEPEIIESKEINIKSMKNPILMSVKESIVENDFLMQADKNSLIITGSNTGGKTVALKTIGLCTLMTKAGLHVPCFSAKIFPFKKIFTDLGDEQSIAQSLSTFSAHMTRIITIVNNADENSLVLLDEICSGTDPKEGFSLAQSILKYLQKTQCFTIATTHYGELKSLSYLESGFQNASVEFNASTLSPTFKLLIGIPGASNAIIIAQNLGLKKAITESANEIYFNKEDETAKVMQELQNTQQKLTDSTNQSIKLQTELEELKIQYEQKLEELNKNKQKTLQNYKKKYETRIANIKSELKEISTQINAEKSETLLRRSFERVSIIESKSRQEFQEEEQEFSQKYFPVDWNTAKINDKYIIKELDQQVVLLSLPDKADNVQIMMGQIKTTIKKAKLAIPNKIKATTQKPKRYSAPTGFSIARHEISQTIDLRAKRVDEALNELEIYLDKASLANLSPVYIIHGHGTGALKEAIRGYLKQSPYIKIFEPAPQAQGGDGVTIADLK